jgi:tetratricopeptide (TPR) repeat protein
VTRGRHLDFFLRFAEDARAKLDGPDAAAWLDRLETELDNLRAALTWSREREEAVKGLRLAAALQLFWNIRAYWAEGRGWLEGLLALPAAQAHPFARGRALRQAGCLVAWPLRDPEAAQPLYEESLAIAEELGDQHLFSMSLNELGQLARERGDLEAARALFEQSMSVARELGSKSMIASVLPQLAGIARRQGDHGRARALLDESVGILRELGNKTTVWVVLDRINLALGEGDDLTARSLAEETLATSRELGYRSAAAHALWALGAVAANRGDSPSARALWAESLALHGDLGEKDNIPRDLNSLAGLAAAEGNPERAARLWGTAAALREAGGHLQWTISTADWAPAVDEERLAAVRTTLGEEAFAAAWAAGQRMSLEDAVSYALEQV